MPAIASLHDIARFSGLARRIRRKKPSSPIKAASPTVNRRPGEPTIPSDLAAARRTIILFATDQISGVPSMQRDVSNRAVATPTCVARSHDIAASFTDTSPRSTLSRICVPVRGTFQPIARPGVRQVR
jgi:hypothetical protein